MWKAFLRGCAVLLVSLGIASLACSQCQVPHYRIGKVQDYDGPTVIADISIRPEDFTIEKLVCLAAALKKRYHRAPEIVVGIFSSHEAAVNYFPPQVEKRPYQDVWASQHHADYYYNPSKREEYVLLIPDELGPGTQLDSRIDLPVTRRPSCRLQIQDRCLIAFDHHIFYTLEPTARSAKVALSAEIQPDGFVSGVRLADPDTTGSKDQRELADSALRNLKSWQFERSSSNDAIALRITYLLERVDTPLKGGIDVQFMLPDSVDIKVGPLLVIQPK